MLLSAEKLQDKDSDMQDTHGAPDITEGYVENDQRITELDKQRFLTFVWKDQINTGNDG